MEIILIFFVLILLVGVFFYAKNLGNNQQVNNNIGNENEILKKQKENRIFTIAGAKRFFDELRKNDNRK